MTTDESYANFWEHVEAFRSTLIKIAAIIFISSLLAFCFYPTLISLLTANVPMEGTQSSFLHTERLEHLRITNPGRSEALYAIPSEVQLISTSHRLTMTDSGQILLKPGQSIEFTRSLPTHKLPILSPTEGFATSLKVSFWVGLVLSSPIWLYILMLFIAPGLHAGERLIFAPFLFASVLFFLSGLVFSYFFTLPIANSYFSLFNAQIGINMWTLAHYLDYTLILLLSNGLAFEVAVVLFFLVHHGFVRGEQLESLRRPMIVAAFILAAVLTPPDVLTQVMLAIPLILIYEGTLFYAKIRQRLAFKVTLNPN